MTFIFDVNKEYHAGANLTDKFLCLETYSGLGRYSSDPDYPCQLLSIDSDDVCIGHELLQALKNSRTYTPEESEEYLSLEKTQVEYDEWVTVLMAKYNYRTRRALFKNMKY
ncbi:TPA: CdiI family contact-dependent growth inhibition immunity protein, partial [Salmonella enterica]|nr:CdiI family contact-dependent growth inhibition immunity protein [Salmonella enterica]